MLLQIFAGSLLPYVESLDSWLFEGTLDDPFEEVGVLGVLFMFHGRETIFLYLFDANIKVHSLQGEQIESLMMMNSLVEVKINFCFLAVVLYSQPIGLG